MRPRLADSYIPANYVEILGAGGSTSIANGNWPTANKAIYMPITFQFPAQLYSLSFAANNGTGNYDLGFYDGYTKLKIASTGTTAMTAAGTKTLSFTPDYRVDPGKLYYAALALSSGSGSALRSNSNIVSLISSGLGEQTSSLPLPSTAAPVTLTSAYAPIFVFGIR